MKPKPNKLRITANLPTAKLIPRPMGILVLAVIVLSFTVGAARQELAPVLAGAVFLALWLYCLLMTLLLALIHRRRARRAFIRISPREVTVGDPVTIIYSEGDILQRHIVQLPGILVRCRLQLSAKDGRRIRHDFNPRSMPHSFTAEKRGAYFSADNATRDEFAVFDILGFFRFAFRLPAESGARLLVSPHAADEPLLVSARAGESHLKPEFSLQRTDNLIDHRPYVPGDDPRRINWKLYGHGGGLFVRDGEREPPPQSNVLILIDTEYDPLLYTASAARHGIDALCENALAAAIACTGSGMNVLIGYPGGAIHGGNVAEIAASLAWPAAASMAAEAAVSVKLPSAPHDYGVIILALPRSGAETSAIDHFLNATGNDTGDHTGTNKRRTIELLFFCGNENGKIAFGNTVSYTERLAAAEVCAALYNQRHGIRASIMR